MDQAAVADLPTQEGPTAAVAEAEEIKKNRRFESGERYKAPFGGAEKETHS